ncbi:hypothetical protein H4219_005309 [Mycoemilia scoparia]|uniref:Uncharacterized protein n=1 Tax=Mycoemilia scoparia TaxID=417184 RepID=A0A9W8DLC8_9FUNG|nr:hypothetical protein H4219_005309 [Mycoemilia scoparia]
MASSLDNLIFFDDYENSYNGREVLSNVTSELNSSDASSITVGYSCQATTSNAIAAVEELIKSRQSITVSYVKGSDGSSKSISYTFSHGLSDQL